LLERFIPYRQAWLRSHGDLALDGAWFLTNGAVYRVFEPPALAAATAAGGWMSSSLGVGLWPSAAPLTAQLALALVTAELFEYWAHRLMHETALLWRFHAIHHSAPRLYWLNAVRFHPVDYVLLGICKLVPLAVLGAPAAVLALVNVFSAVHGSYKHSNVPVRLGPLNWVFSMAELHRWHHSRDVREANRNYGGNLALWDVVFGTRFLPPGREPPTDVGLADRPRFPTGYFAQWLVPFRSERDAG
jgi:sterol desaturase/sphingolipid hydroxylase (fatty acid hydroxylase superfamily)